MGRDLYNRVGVGRGRGLLAFDLAADSVLIMDTIGLLLLAVVIGLAGLGVTAFTVWIDEKLYSRFGDREESPYYDNFNETDQNES